MLTNDELKEQNVKEMIKAGLAISKHLRNGSTTLSINNFSGKLRFAMMLGTLPRGSALVDVADVADLNKVVYPQARQASWDAAKWEREIRNRA